MQWSGDKTLLSGFLTSSLYLASLTVTLSHCHTVTLVMSVSNTHSKGAFLGVRAQERRHTFCTGDVTLSLSVICNLSHSPSVILGPTQHHSDILWHSVFWHYDKDVVAFFVFHLNDASWGDLVIRLLIVCYFQYWWCCRLQAGPAAVAVFSQILKWLSINIFRVLFIVFFVFEKVLSNTYK